MAVVGKKTRTKAWVAGQQIDSFSDLEATSGSSDDDEDGSRARGGQKNGVRRLNGHGREAFDDADGGAASGSGRPDPNDDWDHFEDLLRTETMTSSVHRRLAFLQGPLAHHVRKQSFSLQQLPAVFKALTRTYPRYMDAKSRQAVLDMVSDLVRIDLKGSTQGKFLEAVVAKWIDNEVSNKVCSPTSSASGATIVNILCWTAAVVEVCVRELGVDGFKQRAIIWQPLVRSLAVAYDALQAAHVKASVKHKGTTALRGLMRNNLDLIPEIILVLCRPSEIGLKTPTVTGAMLGLVVDVLLHLRPEKRVQSQPGKQYATQEKPRILAYYREHIVASRTPLPGHITLAFNGFIASCVDESDLATDSDLVKAFDRALLRNPEITLTTADVFFTAYLSAPAPRPLSTTEQRRTLPAGLLQTKLLPPILTASKSTNNLTRSSAALLLSTVAAPYLDAGDEAADVLLATFQEVALPIKTLKTTSPEHRSTLCQMLQVASMEPKCHEQVLQLILETFAASLGKESNEAALKASLECVSAALANLTKRGVHPNNSALLDLLAKGAADSKPAIRRLYLVAVGTLFWSLQDVAQSPDTLGKYASLLPPFENAIKLSAASTSGAAAEGWIALAVLYGPLVQWQPATDLAKKSAPMTKILKTSPKPSFLFSERGFKKLSNAEDEVWLVRALECVLHQKEALEKLAREADFSVTACQPLVFVALESQHHGNRTAALQSISRLCRTAISAGVNGPFTGSLRQWLEKSEHHDVTAAATMEEVIMPDRHARLRALIEVMASPAGDHSSALVPIFVLSHHRFFGFARTSLWVDIVLKAGLDPAKVASEGSDALVATIYEHTAVESPLLREAAYASVSTLVFLAPAVFLPIFVGQTLQQLDLASLSFIDAEAVGIYNTPEGQLYTDVLSKENAAPSASAKGKNAALDKWDAETRKALQAKKQGGSNAISKLLKAEQAVVDAQTRKEAEIRQRVQAKLESFSNACRVLQAVFASRTDSTADYLSKAALALIAASAAPQAVLYADIVLQTLMLLYQKCSPRIQNVHFSLALSVLRVTGAQMLSSDLEEEPLAALVTRVLYRLRFQGEQLPFDPPTFTLALPLLERVISHGGLGDFDEEEADGRQEQLALALDVIAFHVRHFTDMAFPRLATIHTLIEAIHKFPSLSQSASSALIELGQAIESNATIEEINALLQGILVDETQVRHACLQALAPLDLTDLDYSDEIWIACHDSDARNTQLAEQIWQENGLDVVEKTGQSLLQYLSHSSASVRGASAKAIAQAVSQADNLLPEVMSSLSAQYVEAARELVPEYDRFGMLIEASLHQEDPWRARVAVAQTLQHLAPLLPRDQVSALFDLLIVKQALGDRSEDVRSRMLEAGIATVDAKGKQNLQPLMDRFQSYLGASHPPDVVGDRITEAVIVLLGRLARHLEAQDPRINDVLDRLLVALKTPSELVQMAVADCLPPLIRANREKGSEIIEQLLRETLHAAKYAERRGAAYGLAGAIKGRGLTALKEFSVISRLKDALEEKKNANARQGAMFAFETLSITLGRLFEPYIVSIVPQLLAGLGDSATEVREATSDAARVIMSSLSGHTVKVILPLLLDALDDRQWRPKKGAIEVMGSMAYLAPKQLSRSLPSIIPPLTNVLTDTHSQVRAAANASLKKFGEVVNNPEIKAMQGTLLAALVDPSKKTGKALDTLLTTSFVHYIDTSSLALIIPIIDRGLRERSSDIKKKGAQIVGNMASLTDSKDLIPYLPQLLPHVKTVLIDPVPEARATAAKSLGVLIERLGEDAFPTRVDDLIDTLQSDRSGVDQQGAAQGLAEVLSGLGVDRMEEMLPSIISKTASKRAYVREGFISLLIYLPTVFGDRFSPYLSRIISPILTGLADESEYVREASMRAGRMIVNNHSTKAIDLLLPELEKGLFDASWRIRLSSIQLVGELLFRISGISGKAEMEQDAAAGGEDEEDTYTSNAEAARKMLEVLGKDRRDRVLAGLYILRQDSAGQVRMFSIGVWKALVSNTPRTVRDMLPSLINIIVRLLALPESDQQDAAARTLGELCRKQGERILGEIIPILRKAAQGPDSSRQGCCLAFAEILEATSRTQLEGYEDELIGAVRGGLVDESAQVRQAAARAFDALQTQLGPRSIDQTIPTLLAALTQEGAAREAALSALRELMAVRAQAIFPILIPTLIAPPITAFNANALASLVEVAGSALSRRLPQILDALQGGAEAAKTPEDAEPLQHAVRSVMSSVRDSEGLHQLMLYLLELCRNPKATKRIGGCRLFSTFCEVAEMDFDDYYVDWVRLILALYEDSSEEVVSAAIDSMTAFSKVLTKEQMESLAPGMRRVLEGSGGSGDRTVQGFNAPGGLKPIIPILVQGLLAGTHEQREQAAYAFGDIVERTSTDALKPYVTQITGPLIRIIAERYPPPIKVAILSTLNILLQRASQFVKPFFPQLQRTFVKNLSEMSSLTIRQKAAAGLGTLMLYQPRIDPLVTELLNGVNHDEREIQEAMASALGVVMVNGGANLGPAVREGVAQLVRDTLEEPRKELFNTGISRAFVGMLRHGYSQASEILSSIVETKATTMSSATLLLCLEEAPQQLYEVGEPARIVSRILKNVINDNTSIARPAREARELLRKTEPWSQDEQVQARLE